MIQSVVGYRLIPLYKKRKIYERSPFTYKKVHHRKFRSSVQLLLLLLPLLLLIALAFTRALARGFLVLLSLLLLLLLPSLLFLPMLFLYVQS
jgi:hypothetical protein